jgi:hypothetical protein
LRGGDFRIVQPPCQSATGPLDAIIHQCAHKQRAFDPDTYRTPFEPLYAFVGTDHQADNNQQGQHRAKVSQSGHGAGEIQGRIDHDRQHQPEKERGGHGVHD